MKHSSTLYEMWPCVNKLPGPRSRNCVEEDGFDKSLRSCLADHSADQVTQGFGFERAKVLCPKIAGSV